MKKVLVLAISLLLASCAVQKHTTLAKAQLEGQTTEASQTSAAQATTATNATLVDESVSSSTDLAEDEQVTTEVIEYDTTQPTDSTTGTPPIKSRMTQTRNRTAHSNKATQAQRQEATEGRLQQETVTQQAKIADTQVTTDVQVVDTTKRGLSWWQKTLCIVGLSALLYLSVRLFIKIRTRF